MKFAIILAVFILTGCVTTPVARNFPDVPTELNSPCSNLKQLDANTTKLSDVVSNVSANYGLYQECQIKATAWAEWYKTQKQIFNEVK
jgi:hypothetical protein